jgi:hypothetical protein
MTPAFKYQGWIRGPESVWRASCASNSVYDCTQLLRKIANTIPCWTSTVVLPFDEAPIRSRSIHDGGL